MIKKKGICNPKVDKGTLKHRAIRMLLRVRRNTAENIEITPHSDNSTSPTSYIHPPVLGP